MEQINELLNTSYRSEDFVRFNPGEVREVIEKLVDVLCANLSSDHQVLPKGARADDLAAVLRTELVRLYGHADADAPIDGWKVPPAASN